MDSCNINSNASPAKATPTVRKNFVVLVRKWATSEENLDPTNESPLLDFLHKERKATRPLEISQTLGHRQPPIIIPVAAISREKIMRANKTALR